MSQSSIITISNIHTSCKDCVFSIYSENTQTGCSLDLINKYKTKDTNIIEAYDEDKEFFIINDKKCIGYRNSAWSNNDGNQLSIEEKKDKIKNEFKIKYILFIDLKSITADQFDTLIENIKNIDIKPSKLILLRYNYTNKIFEYDYIRDKLKDSNLNCEWRIQTMVEDDIPIRSILSSTIATNTQYKFILYVSEYTNIEELNKIANTANETIYEELGTFVVLSNKEYTAKLFLGLIYRYAWHSSGVDILDTKDDFTLIS